MLVKSQSNLYPQQVNQAVSFSAIKNHVIDLLFIQPDQDLLLAQSDENLLLAELTQLFLMKPTLIRQGRFVPGPNQHYFC